MRQRQADRKDDSGLDASNGPHVGSLARAGSNLSMDGCRRQVAASACWQVESERSGPLFIFVLSVVSVTLSTITTRPAGVTVGRFTLNPFRECIAIERID
jgi:hypothetical protein